MIEKTKWTWLTGKPAFWPTADMLIRTQGCNAIVLKGGWRQRPPTGRSLKPWPHAPGEGRSEAWSCITFRQLIKDVSGEGCPMDTWMDLCEDVCVSCQSLPMCILLGIRTSILWVGPAFLGYYSDFGEKSLHWGPQVDNLHKRLKNIQRRLGSPWHSVGKRQDFMSTSDSVLPRKF